MPTPIDSLYLIGEISLVLTGFAGTVTALNRRTPDQWTLLERTRLILLFSSSIGVFGFSMLGICLLHAGVAEDPAWRLISAGGAVLSAVLAFRVTRVARLAGRDDPQSPGLAVVPLGLLILAAIAAQLWNLAAGMFWPVMLLLATLLFQGSAAFALLLFRRLPAAETAEPA